MFFLFVVVVVVVVVVVAVVVVVSFVVVFGRVATSGVTAPRKEHFKQLKFSNQPFLSPCSILIFPSREICLLVETCEASDACHLPPRAALTNPEKSSFVGDLFDSVVADFYLRISSKTSLD